MGYTRNTGQLSYLITYDGSGNITVPASFTQTTVTSSMLKADSSGKLVAAVAGTDFVAPAGLSAYVPTTRTITINGTSYDLSADRSWSIVSGVSSFNTRTGAITLTDTDVTGALGYTPVTNARTLTINGTTYDLSANRSWSIVAGLSSFNTRTGAITLLDTDVTGALGYTPVTNARTITINGTTYDLSANRTWVVDTSSVTTRVIQKFTATASQTAFTVTGGYTVGMVDVFLNGIKLDNAVDFTATDGSVVTLTVAAASGDIVEVYKYGGQFIANNSLRQTTAFTATAGQTTFTVSYSVGFVDVFYNGSKLAASEFTATNGTSIVLGTACVVNDIVEVVAYNYTVGAFTGVGGSGTTNYIPKWTASGTLGNSIIYDNGTSIGVGTSSPDNTYQGITLYGTNPSLRLKGSATGSWNWIEYVTSAGVNNFSMGVSQSTPLFVIKAGAGLDNPDFVMTSNGSIGIGTVSPGSYQLGGKFVVAGSTSAFYFNESNNRIVLDGSGTNRDLSFYFRYSNSATIESDSYLKMVLSGSEKFRISSDGRIGIGTSAPSALLDVYNSSTSGWSVRAVVRDANFASFLGTYYFSSTGRPGVYAHNSALNAWSTLYVNTLDGSASNGGQVILSSKTSVGATDHASNSSALDVSGAVRYGFARRSIAGWWSGTVPDASGTRYFHLKTNMWAGGGGQGNTDYTMSLFKGLFYSYSTKIVREGAVGFHNWSGSIYEIATVGNLWANVYASSDGYVVIVADVSSSSYGGLVIDWHQNYGYPFRDRNVTATGLHTSASGLY